MTNNSRASAAPPTASADLPVDGVQRGQFGYATAMGLVLLIWCSCFR
ncbi:MAG: hypothetical protein U0Z44_17705 [Kouleothrix sp.]